MNNTLPFNEYRWNYPHLGNILNNSWENVILNNFQEGFFNEDLSKSWRTAVDSINDQIRKNPELLKNINPQDLAVAFSGIWDTFFYLNPVSVYAQITSLNSLVIKAETKEGNIYAEVFFDKITGWQSEMVVNIFKNQQMEFNNSGSFEDMILAIKQYLYNPVIDYSTYSNQTAEYALSGTAFATAEF